MFRTKSFPARAEIVLIAAMLLGFVLIAQQWSPSLYQLGLVIVVVSTLLEIAVGNIPKTASFGRSLVYIVVILAIVVAVFLFGIALVPYLTNLGR